jgi:hypothetical protein
MTLSWNSSLKREPKFRIAIFGLSQTNYLTLRITAVSNFDLLITGFSPNSSISAFLLRNILAELSLIPGAGLGLFATKDFRVKEYLNWNNLDERTVSDPS